MDLIAAINREERKLEKELTKLQGKLNGVRAACKSMAGGRPKITEVKSELCPLLQKAKISKATKARWANSEPRRTRRCQEFDNPRSRSGQEARFVYGCQSEDSQKQQKARWAKFRAQGEEVGRRGSPWPLRVIKTAMTKTIEHGCFSNF